MRAAPVLHGLAPSRRGLPATLLLAIVLGSVSSCAQQRPPPAPVGEVHSEWDGFRRVVPLEDARSQVSTLSRRAGSDETLEDLVARCRSDNERFGQAHPGRISQLSLRDPSFCAPLEGETNVLLLMFQARNVTDIMLVYRLDLSTGELVKFLYYMH